MFEAVHARLESLEKELAEIKKMLRSKEKFTRAAGGWKDLDTEKLKKDIYDSRTRPSRC